MCLLLYLTSLPICNRMHLRYGVEILGTEPFYIHTLLRTYSGHTPYIVGNVADVSGNEPPSPEPGNCFSTPARTVGSVWLDLLDRWNATATKWLQGGACV